MADQAHGYKLDAGDGERLTFSDAVFVIRAGADTTGGAFSIIEEIDPLDTPAHVHAREDELFYVIEGEHVFRVGDEEFRAGPGAVVFPPRGVPHTHRRVVPRTGRMLTMLSPAGFEGFFRELSPTPSAPARPTRRPTPGRRSATGSPGSIRSATRRTSLLM